MGMSYGWGGRILRVNLTTRDIKIESLPKDFAINYVGGSGFGAKILYDEVGPDVDALSPKSIIILGQGPLCETLVPSSGRYELVAKSPLTGLFARSNGGGTFGPKMKEAGYDLVLIGGQSDNPVYLWIEDEHVSLRNATHMWGQTAWSTREMVCDELDDPDIGTLVIGPAGENLCFSSAVISDQSRAAAKCGIAAVWGSKKLKAVAIRGSKGVEVAKPLDLLQLCKAISQRFKEDPLYESMSKYGTMGWVGGAYARSQAGKLMFGTEGTSKIWETALETHCERSLACSGCPIHCSHYYRVKSGKYRGTKGEGIEGNCQIYAGMSLRVFDAAFLLRYNSLCNELGINLDVAGSAINWAMHLYEAGIITKEDTDGLKLTWGNQDAILELLPKIAYKDGFGAILDGFPIRSTNWVGRGSELYATHTKGLYSTGFGPGICPTLAYTLAQNVATRGFDHLTGGPTMYTPGLRQEWGITDELLKKLGEERYNDPEIFTEPWAGNPNKAKVVYDCENLCALADMTGVCKFATRFCLATAGLDISDLSELLTATTGETFSTENLVKAAEREFALERAYNAREGVRRVDDYPFFLAWQLRKGKPHPLFDYESLPVKLENYNTVLDEYYRLRGCDLETGIPLGSKLEELGLKYVADDLRDRKLLPNRE